MQRMAEIAEEFSASDLPHTCPELGTSSEIVAARHFLVQCISFEKNAIRASQANDHRRGGAVVHLFLLSRSSSFAGLPPGILSAATVKA